VGSRDRPKYPGRQFKRPEQSLAATRADKLGRVDEKMDEKEESNPHRAINLVCFLVLITLQNAQ